MKSARPASPTGRTGERAATAGLAPCQSGSHPLAPVVLPVIRLDFALNNISENVDKEFTGTCYSPDGDVLFGNIQTPGVSFTIRGPFSRGTL